MQKARTYRVVLRKETEGAYTALAPSLPRCITGGSTIEEAIEMVKDAIESCIAVMQQEGETIPA